MKTLSLLTLAAILLAPVCMPAEDHVVSPAELHKQIQTAAQVRQSEQLKLEKFFSAEPVKNALQTAKVDPLKAQKAVPFLSDDELAWLAAQADKVQSDFAAGALTNQELTYIVIALATAVIILVIVAA